MRTLAWLLVVVLAMAACSSGTGKPSLAVTPTTSKADFVARANAICTTMNTKSNALQDPGKDAVKLKQVLDASIPITADGLSQLRALPEPAGDEAKLRGFFTTVDKFIGDLRDESAAVGANDLTRVKEIGASLQDDSKAIDAAAGAYGINVCGSG